VATLIERVRFGLTDPVGAVRHLLRKRRFPWQDGGQVQRRQYASYDEYVKHQREKLDARDDAWLSEFDEQYRAALRLRLADAGVVIPRARVLCLAARLGTEVRAFLDLGCFALGLDLNPGKDNKYVVNGDFHEIQFATASVDLVFTNALDHAFDMGKLIGEIRRVLAPDGTLVLEIVNGRREGYAPGYFEASIWERIDDVVTLFCEQGFRIVKRVAITYPWDGQMVCFARADAGTV
jgi:SAM-dependent methyltransferase